MGVLSDVPVFGNMIFKSNGLPYIPYRLAVAVMGENDQQKLFGGLCPDHGGKRFGWQFRQAGHTCELGDVSGSSACALKSGLPIKAFVGTDNQSTDQRARLFNPGYVKPAAHWDSFGLSVTQLIAGLIFGSWLSSPALTHEQLFENSIGGHYLFMMCWQRAYEKHGKDNWQKRFFFHCRLARTFATWQGI